jgi:hypothetical protein
MGSSSFAKRPHRGKRNDMPARMRYIGAAGLLEMRHQLELAAVDAAASTRQSDTRPSASVVRPAPVRRVPSPPMGCPIAPIG